MPELPEVETTARMIAPHLEGRRIEGSRVLWLRTLGGGTAAGFERSVSGARIVAVRRRGKFIVIDLTRDAGPAGSLLVHLRMSGRLYVEPREVEQDRHVRVSLQLDEGVLRFVDVRKFGRFTYVPDAASALASLGPEPLGQEFTQDWLREQLSRRSRMLKPLLLDQSFLAGLGNIYVDEALFRSRLHPMKISRSVSKAAAHRLHREIRATLEEAIEREGSSFDTFYRTPEGQPGRYQHQFRVYGRAGKPCRVCARMIKRLVVGQRGTHVCTRCQAPPKGRKLT